MIRRPPRSTLFPYTTALPISNHHLAATLQQAQDRRLLLRQHAAPGHTFQAAAPAGTPLLATAAGLPLRLEEHTAELQSRQYLVCRLLLGKKTSTHVTLFSRTA